MVQRNPQAIVFIEAWWSTAEEKKALVLHNPALANVDAVREKAFFVLPFTDTTSVIRVPEAVLRLARAMYPELFPEESHRE